MPEESCKATDLTRGWSALLLWCLPGIALLAGLHDEKYRLALWIPALLVMGGGCLINAARCGRMHCYITGPILLLAAVYAAFSGFHLAPMHPAIFLDLILAVAVLACLAELPLGRYRKRAQSGGPEVRATKVS